MATRLQVTRCPWPSGPVLGNREANLLLRPGLAADPGAGFANHHVPFGGSVMVLCGLFNFRMTKGGGRRGRFSRASVLTAFMALACVSVYAQNQTPARIPPS